MKLLAAVPFVAGLLMLVPQPALACECLARRDWPKPTPDWIIAVGRVEAMRRLDASARIVAVDLLVSEAFQNVPPQTRVTVYTDIGLGMACEAADLRLGLEYLFYTRPVSDSVPFGWEDEAKRLPRNAHVVGACNHGGALPLRNAEQRLRQLRAETRRRD